MIPPDFQPTILRFDSVGSTNDKLKELALQGATEGTIVVAKRQTRGKGRLGRTWNSPLGGLYLSALLYPLSAKRITDLSFLVGVAVVQTLQELLPKMVDISLKWPNDVLADKKKIAGILSEAFEDEKFFGAVVGVGLNANTPHSELQAFQNNRFQATSMNAFLEGKDTPLEGILELFSIKLFNLYRFYQEKGFAPIRALWEKNCRMIGKQVEVQGVEPLGSTVKGKFWGLSDRGGLVLEGPNQERLEILSGELTCCWF